MGYPRSLAVDGVDEVVAFFFPRQVRLQRIAAAVRRPWPSGRRDSVGWVLAGDGTGASDGPADAEVSGPAELLVLLLWGRLGLDDPQVQVTGDRAAAVSVLSAGIVP